MLVIYVRTWNVQGQTLYGINREKQRSIVVLEIKVL